MPEEPKRHLLSRYHYDSWYDEGDGRLYVKATALQYERVSEETFAAIVLRRLRQIARRDGVLGDGEMLRYTHGVEEWDRSYNIADSLLETLTYRTATPVAHLRAPAAAA